MKKIWKRVCTGILALTTILTALPITSVQAAETQYWTESSERVGYIEHVMNDGSSMYHMCFSIMHLEESRQVSAIRQSFRWQHRRKEKAERLIGDGMDLEAG